MRNLLSELLPGNRAFPTDIVIAPSLRGMAEELLARIGFAGSQAIVVCDADTHAALGHRLMKELGKQAHLLELPGNVKADETALKRIREMPCDVLVAAGSGTISDLCKYASFIDKKPYAVFPTAPSMNGYLSANASVSLRGVKESQAAHLPSGVFCDMAVIAAAPLRLLQSGLGDSLARPTAQGDWLLSHLLLGTPYFEEPYEWLRPYERELFAQAEKLLNSDPAVVELLMKVLLISGLGMTLAGGSYPASQGEHMIAHTMEIKHGGALPPTFHGEQIGVAALTMARIQQERLTSPLRLPPLPRWREALAAYLGKTHGERIADQSKKNTGFMNHMTRLRSIF